MPNYRQKSGIGQTKLTSKNKDINQRIRIMIIPTNTIAEQKGLVTECIICTVVVELMSLNTV